MAGFDPLKYPSLPSNYVSIAHLKERWIKEKEREQQEEEKEKREKEEKENTQFFKVELRMGVLIVELQLVKICIRVEITVEEVGVRRRLKSLLQWLKKVLMEQGGKRKWAVLEMENLGLKEMWVRF